MTDFDSVLSAAQQLPEQDRIRLIDAISQTISAEAERPLSAEWAAEIERRLATLGDGTAKPIPWEDIRDAALMRSGHGTIL